MSKRKEINETYTDNIINEVMHTRMIVRKERGRACDSITTESAQTAKNSV